MAVEVSTPAFPEEPALCDVEVEMAPKNVHDWPTNDDHVWGPWMSKTGLPKPTDYRTCVHPKCKGVEVREASKA
jgi:hypothetical protein